MNILRNIISALGHWRWVIVYELLPVYQTKKRLAKTLERVRRKVVKNEKIRVVFLSGETSKWKVQSLYDWMKKSSLFEPCVALTLAQDVVASLKEEDRKAKLLKAHAFFEQRGIKTKEILNPQTGEYYNLKKLEPDIIFYYQPWNLPKVHLPHIVAKDALTCYVPYYVPNYGDLEMDAQQPFHRTIWAYFMLNEDWASLFRGAVRPWMTASQIVGLGHTMLDVFNTLSTAKDSHLVIYAPHWSIDVPGNENAENYGTFHLNGRRILDYARQHREFQWLFKPHPDLRKVLSKTGWTQEEIDAYYDAWKELGGTCETGDYPQLFMQSCLMITDCGSFLTEYACTGKPILHLICPTCKKKPFPQSGQLFDLYYQAHDISELEQQLELLLVKGEDPRRDERIAMVEKLKLRGTDAAGNIGQWLTNQIKG